MRCGGTKENVLLSTVVKMEEQAVSGDINRDGIKELGCITFLNYENDYNSVEDQIMVGYGSIMKPDSDSGECYEDRVTPSGLCSAMFWNIMQGYVGLRREDMADILVDMLFRHLITIFMIMLFGIKLWTGRPRRNTT